MIVKYGVLMIGIFIQILKNSNQGRSILIEVRPS